MNHPLLPLEPLQRLGWLPHFKTLRCKKAFAGFEKGESYAMTTCGIRVTTGLHKARRDGVRESITLTGQEMMVIVTAGNGWRHRFHTDPTKEHPVIHNLEFLVEHFSIPPVPDVAASNPKAFAAMKARLRALES